MTSKEDSLKQLVLNRDIYIYIYICIYIQSLEKRIAGNCSRLIGDVENKTEQKKGGYWNEAIVSFSLLKGAKKKKESVIVIHRQQ